MLVALGAGLFFRLVYGQDPTQVQVAVAAQREITSSILASGMLAYESQVTLVSEVLGRVDDILVKEGDRVTRGQLVMRLDGEAARAEVEQLRASREQALLGVQRQRVQLEAARTRIQRNEELRRLGLVEPTKYDDLATQRDLTEIELRNSQKAVEQVDAQLDQSRQRLARTAIRAPIDGRVIQINIRSGETAVPSAMSIAGGSLMVIADTRGLFADVSVDEGDIARVEAGQAATIVPVAYPDQPLTGVVDRVALTPKAPAAAGQGQGRSYAVRVRLAAQGPAAFKPGMSARVEIIVSAGRSGRPSVPVQAIVYEEAQRPGDAASASVFVSVDGKASRRSVETGIADDLHIEIARGIRSGEPVIVGPARALRQLRDGVSVVALSASAPDPDAGPPSRAASAGQRR